MPPAVDTFASYASGLGTPAINGFAIAPSDTVPLTYVTRYIYVGGAGNITLVMLGGETITLEAVPVGTLLPIRAVQVMATGTTATNLVALY